MQPTNKSDDQDIHKGAVENDNPNAHDNNTSLRGQQGHRNMPEVAEGTDTDYPEPGQNPEHSGEKVEKAADRKPSGSTQSEQKSNQNQRKEDPLAS